MSQLYSHLPVQSRHLFLLCLHHPVITFRFLSVINFEGIHPVCLRPGSLSHHRHFSCHIYLSLIAPPVSPTFVVCGCLPSAQLARTTAAPIGCICGPLLRHGFWYSCIWFPLHAHISSVYASCFLVDVFRVSPSPYDAFVSIELSYCIIAIRLPIRNTVLLLDFSLFWVLIFSVHLFPSF